MRFAFVLLVVGALAGCGGGGSSPLFTAELQGMVYEVDGQTVDREGIEILLVETGQSATTDANGSFVIPDLPEGSYTIGVNGLLQSAEGEDDGPPVVEISRSNGVVSIHMAIRDGEVVEFSMAHHNHARASSRLEPAAGSTLPDETEAKLRIDSRPDRERLWVTVEGLTEGDEVVLCMRDPEVAESVFTDVGSATADAEGGASIRFDTKRGDALPADAASLDDLAGYLVVVKVNGDDAFEGVVPPLPEAPDGPRRGPPSFENRARGMAHLVALVDDVEGKVTISRWPAMNRQRFKFSAEGLAEGDELSFRVEDPDNAGTFVEVGTATADADGEAKVDTKKGLPMPFDVADVEELVGLGVQVVRGTDVILEGTVPALVSY